MQVWVGGKPGLRARQHRVVAHQAIDPEPGHVMLVAERHGLRQHEIGPARPSRCAGQTHHQNTPNASSSASPQRAEAQPGVRRRREDRRAAGLRADAHVPLAARGRHRPLRNPRGKRGLAGRKFWSRNTFRFGRRRRMGIEPTARCSRATGFEDQGGHQTPIASAAVLTRSPPQWRVPAGRPTRRVNPMASRCSSSGTLNLREMPSAAPTSLTNRPGGCASSGANRRLRLRRWPSRWNSTSASAPGHARAPPRPRAPAGPARACRRAGRDRVRVGRREAALAQRFGELRRDARLLAAARARSCVRPRHASPPPRAAAPCPRRAGAPTPRSSTSAPDARQRREQPLAREPAARGASTAGIRASSASQRRARHRRRPARRSRPAAPAALGHRGRRERRQPRQALQRRPAAPAPPQLRRSISAGRQRGQRRQPLQRLGRVPPAPRRVSGSRITPPATVRAGEAGAG